MAKYNDIRRLAGQHAKEITRFPRDYLDYLDTAARLYRYDFGDTLLIHAQKPEATACAELEIWNNRMGRWVNRGAKGIALIDDSTHRKALRYVFDLSDTHMVKGGRSPWLWQLTPEMEIPIMDHLVDTYDLDPSDIRTVPDAIREIVRLYTEDSLRDAMDGLGYELHDSLLEGMDEDALSHSFKFLLEHSAFYMIMRRCRLEPLAYLSAEDFQGITDYNTLSVLSFLGNGVHDIAEPVLRDIGRTLMRLYQEKAREEKQKELDNSFNTGYNEFNTLNQESIEQEGADGHDTEDGDHIPAQRGLPLPQPDHRRESPDLWEIWDAEGELSTGEPEELVPEHEPDGEIARAPAGNRQEGSREDGTDHGSDSGEGEGNTGTESQGHDGMDTADEQHPQPGRGDRPGGISLQLTDNDEWRDIDGAEDELPSAFSLPEYPSTEVQKRKITERVQALFAVQIPISADMVDEILRTGSNHTGSQLRLIFQFMSEQTPEEYTDFVKREYGRGGKGLVIRGREYSVWFDEPGMQIAVGHSVEDKMLDKALLSWEDISERIRQLLLQGEYAPQPVLDAARDNAVKEHAQVLAYMEREMDKEVAQIVFGDTEMFAGGFPDVTDKISTYLSSPSNVDELVERLSGLAAAWRDEPDIMRSRFYNPERVLKQFVNFAKERIPFDAREGFAWEELKVFITQDEIDAFLADGGPYSDGRLSTYSFYLRHEDEKERIDYIRNRYGTGGRSHALSGADDSHADYDAKGLRLERGNYGNPKASVLLTWPKVAKRVDYLIKNDRFLTAGDHARIPAYERGQMARQVILFYSRLPEDIHRPFTRELFNDTSIKEVTVMLSEPENTDHLLSMMDEALASLPLDYEGYEQKVRILSQIHSYADGDFTIFPQHVVEPEPWSPSRQQLSFFDLVTAPLEQSMEESGEAEKEPGQEPGQEAGETDHGSADGIFVGTEEQEEPDKELSVENPVDQPIPLNGAIYIEGREFRIDNVDYDRGVVSLQDMTMAREARYPIFREEPLERVRTLLREEGIKDQEDFQNHGEPDEHETAHEPVNFRITADDLGAGSPKAKFNANMEAIYLLKALEDEGRLANAKEQEVLSGYVGWGGLPQAFDLENKDWEEEAREVKSILNPEEYRAARASTLNAFYTPPTVIKAMYETLQRMGLSSGNVLEPSCGIGNFMGLVPDGMQDIRMYGVELDSISGRIAAQLYQKNRIAIRGFEETDFPDSFFDCVIGNVPFGQYKVPDRRYDRLGFLVHDYFIAKALDLTRPGGVVAVLTSSGTMDKLSESVREYLAGRADLLGAVRLPDNAFMRNANTRVVADILFFQKRDRAPLTLPDWVHLADTPEGYRVNSYFVEHPEMVLGKFTMESTQYGRQELTVKAFEGAVLASQLAEAVRGIEGTIEEAELTDSEIDDETEISIPADPEVKNFGYANVNGEVYYRENSRMHLMDLPVRTKERILGMIGIRDATQELLDLQMNDGSDAEVKILQDRLTDLYDSFTASYGLISSTANRRAFAQDSSYCLLASLEILDEEGKLLRKADIFSKRTIRRAEPVTSVDTPSEALALSIGEKAGVDLPFMSGLCGKTEEEIIQDLSGVIFKNPLTEQFETSDEYLSGNVREKLSIAKDFAARDPDYQVNVEYLARIQPKDLDASEIEVRLGATWVDPAYVQQFMEETFQTPWYLAAKEIRVEFSPVNGQWNVSGKTKDPGNALVNSTYGTGRASAYRLLEDALNLRDTKLYDTVEDAEGKEHRVLNKKETMLAQQKQEMIREKFKEWIFSDMDRREDLCRTYNELFNSIRPREYDGSHIRFVGMSPEITLMDHQKNAVAHILYGHNTLLAHCVGAGKTFQMVAAGMESRRLGLARKCLYVVPNHLTEQWGSDFLRLYPGANILVATKKDFEPANRKKFCSRIATGDYDAVIIGHTQFERIPLSRERQMASIRKQIDDIEMAIEDAADQEGTRYSIKQMEKTRKALEVRLAKLNDQERKDDVVTFEQLGVDRLFVDESHNFKNLFLYTKMRNVAGISQTDAQKSSDMFMKCQYLDELTGGKGVTFATGTPVSNSMVELYTIMRYLQYDTLQKLGLYHFDSWAASFGETVTAIELSPEGTGYRAKTRFARFFNLPELISLFKEAADVQTADMLDLPVPEAEYINEVLRPSQIQKDMVASFADRAEVVRNGGVDAKVDNMLKITNDGRKCALDQRLINDMLPDEPESKVNLCVKNVYDVWKETGTDRLTQLIFCDLSTPKADGSFNVYDDIREKLSARGVPREEIVFIHEANTETRKAELFAKVRSGQVRILLGSTPKLGAGTNVQDRLIALHHLDCPWKPSDLEQQEGRILRQGNRNPKVRIFRYVTEGTFDAYMWQILENKQKFISQIMTSKSPVRACEDVDDAALSYAEIKALATGNPYIKEKMDLDIQVSKLKLLKASHTSNRYRLETDIAKRYPLEIAAAKERIEGLTKDAKAAAPVIEKDKDDFSMVIGGKEYTDRKEAGTALIAACAGLKAVGSGGTVGDYQGFSLSSSFDSFFQTYRLTIKRQCSYTIEVGRDPYGNIQRINNALSGITKQLTETEQKLENLNRQLATAKEEVAKPFPQEEELKAKNERLAELNSLLNMDERDAAGTLGLDEETEVNVSEVESRIADRKPSVLDRLQEKKEAVSNSLEKGTKSRKLAPAL
ncbi:MAG: N-6 DNA methylase [Eubacterium sp.]|nr:N-6 DNA methylase [Eubacterium sp.]